MVSGATFGSTPVTDHPSAHRAATAASVEAPSLSMPPSSKVPRHEGFFSSGRKEEKFYIEDCMKIIIVCTFVRAVTANESVLEVVYSTSALTLKI